MLLTSDDVLPERLTYPSVFKAYTRLGLAVFGTQLHGIIIKLGLESDPFIRNTILHIKSKELCKLEKLKTVHITTNQRTLGDRLSSMVHKFGQNGWKSKQWEMKKINRRGMKMVLNRVAEHIGQKITLKTIRRRLR
ncbi:pentatricopeptide repeat (PPR-like) superfamily protein [Striga asiatica]|uniref:Pentatricopeptide repeat (PPR-like) superfamily protein n=1 Tax=Striga asiatica TaxID=4170 RepID=A0A5A7R6K6_STRAF|nr:pentatricopeptide repeat (PPR-like) superfamily protein [Striga asiatica]